ncbi:ketopantoate reductase [Rhizobiales bacterium GAS191]|jgi:2-dehydropantoate 2-reductase|nr:ketopantoate reductase [Rhizobiales bacterium GAS113]SEE16836.1 ketopantoate reductase [Rhizobiales bacterium GAS191]
MRIAVLGAGSVGGVVAWHLARAGAEPVVVARSESAERLAREGLTLIGASGPETVKIAATADPQALGSRDLVIVALKAQDWPAALPLLRPLLGDETIVVPMLNGMPWWYFQGLQGAMASRRIVAVDPDGALGAAIPVRHILGCVVYMGASREAPNRIRWNGRRRLLLGEPPGGASPRLQRVVGLLADAGLNAEAAPDIRRAIWQKILGNVAHNPLSVVTGAAIGHLATEPHLKAIMRAVMEEAAAVAAALGVTGFDIEERLQVAPEMMDFRTSMLQDFEAGRPLELGAIVDAVIEIGKAEGVSTPVLSTIGALARDRWQAKHGAPRLE